ncbi:hypothetical protein L1887_45972 [Cichorium endivia]|nr:hypothetical protein L1887_45972 [Cichorium endivia]
MGNPKDRHCCFGSRERGGPSLRELGGDGARVKWDCSKGAGSNRRFGRTRGVRRAGSLVPLLLILRRRMDRAKSGIAWSYSLACRCQVSCLKRSFAHAQPLAPKGPNGMRAISNLFTKILLDFSAAGLIREQRAVVTPVSCACKWVAHEHSWRMAFGRQLDSEATRGQLEREGKREREREQELRFIFTEPAAFGPFLGRRRRSKCTRVGQVAPPAPATYALRPSLARRSVLLASTVQHVSARSSGTMPARPNLRFHPFRPFGIASHRIASHRLTWPASPPLSSVITASVSRTASARPHQSIAAHTPHTARLWPNPAASPTRNHRRSAIQAPTSSLSLPVRPQPY